MFFLQEFILLAAVILVKMGSMIGKAMDENMSKQQKFMLESQQIMVKILYFISQMY